MRFNVGDRVICNLLGEDRSGKIDEHDVDLYDLGFYRVKFDNDNDDDNDDVEPKMDIKHKSFLRLDKQYYREERLKKLLE